MITPIYRYPLDGTGTSPDNLVAGEEHQLSNRTVRCVAPTYGGFFAESVVVKDLATNMTLVKGVDYTFGELFEFPTGRYGKEIFGLIAITKPNVTSVAINYQALGGDYSYSMDAIIAMLDNLELGARPVEWGSIVNRPALYDPASHFHDLGDVYGFEYIVHSIDRLRQAVLMGDTVSHDEIYRYIDTAVGEIGPLLQVVAEDLTEHTGRVDNPHTVTKAQVGLSNVQNYGIASQAQMDAGTANNVYLTPITVAKYVTDKAVTPLSSHVGKIDNPHNVTKTQVGLGSVQNYGVASEAEALAGTSTDKYMTPFLVNKAVKSLASDGLTNHLADKENPHAVTKTQVGLGSVDNYSTATSAECIAANATNRFVTPKGMRDLLENWYTNGWFDSRYIRADSSVKGSIHVREDLGTAYVWINSAWRQFWPPLWQ